MTRVSKSASSTTSFTRPSREASASVRTYGPTAAGPRRARPHHPRQDPRDTLLGNKTQPDRVAPNLALAAAKRTSHISARVKPNPIHGPLMAAMTSCTSAVGIRLPPRIAPSARSRRYCPDRRRATRCWWHRHPKVGAGAETAAGTGDDDDAHRLVGVGLVDQPVERDGEVHPPGVEPVGAVEGEHRDAVVAEFVADCVCGGRHRNE